LLKSPCNLLFSVLFAIVCPRKLSLNPKVDGNVVVKKETRRPLNSFAKNSMAWFSWSPLQHWLHNLVFQMLGFLRRAAKQKYQFLLGDIGQKSEQENSYIKQYCRQGFLERQTALKLEKGAMVDQTFVRQRYSIHRCLLKILDLFVRGL